jgi:membrane-associated protein
MEWPDRFLKRHGAKTVFIARFIALFPPVAANLVAGMSKLSWPTFLAYDLAGSVAYAATYILVGHFFGRRWKVIEAWLGSTTLYAILVAVAFVACGVVFRHSLTRWPHGIGLKRQRGG